MSYVVGFVVPVPTAKKDAYLDFAQRAVDLFREFGVKRGVEAWGDDVQAGKVTDFIRSVDGRPDETIVFSWHEYADGKAAADANQKMMNDPRMANMGEMPFDGQRMIYGGFETIVDTGAKGGMGYADGTMIAVPTAKREAFTELAKKQAQVLLEYGATRVVEAWGDYLIDGQVTDFKRAVNAKADETPVFSFVEWASRDDRNAAWPKLMSDPRMAENGIYDAERRVFGGFSPILDF